MKQRLFFLLFLILTGKTEAQDSTIAFSPLAYPEIFKEAKAQGKMVFLYFHFHGCGACVQMKKTTFRDPEVIRYFNEHFISFDINTLEGEGLHINKTYQVKSHPTFMFLDDTGKIVHTIVGVFTPEEFLRHAQSAVTGTGTLPYYREQYGNGNRDPEFLRSCTYAMRDAYEIPPALIQEYLQTQSTDQLKEEHNLRYIYEFAYHAHQPMVAFGSPVYHFMMDHRDLLTAHFDPEQVDTRLVFIALHSAGDAITQLNDTLFEKTTAVLRQFPSQRTWAYKEMDGRITAMVTAKSIVSKLEIEYAKAKNEDDRARRLTREYARSLWHDAEALNTMAWDRYTGESSRSELKEALSWVKRSIQLDANYYNMDTYAALLYRTGQYKSARRIATRAIEMAKESGLSYQETEDLLKKMDEGK